jgi:uncharacterized protein
LGSGALRPVTPADRIVEADIVRGFALFGVLLVNMFSFVAVSSDWNLKTDQSAFAMMHILFDSKSLTLFSILFGFGMAVQLQRAVAGNGPVYPVFFRRLVFLFMLGAAHTLLFDGDILLLYAELGLGLLILRGLPVRLLPVLAVGFMLVFPVSHLATPEREFGSMQGIEYVADAATQLAVVENTEIFANGSLADIVVFNSAEIRLNPFEDFNWSDSGLALFAMMLLGFSVGRSGFLRNIPDYVDQIRRIRVWGLLGGFSAMAVEQVLTPMPGFGSMSTMPIACVFISDLLFSFATVALALGYAATLILAAQTPSGRVILSPFIAVGRMALTVYLTQTLIFISLLYGFGFGLAYRLGPSVIVALALIIFATQLIFCQWWLSRFRFGPFEWLWRSFTYLNWQPLSLNK